MFGKTIQDVFDAMQTAYKVKDQKQGAKDALAIYAENLEFLNEQRNILSEIDDLADVLRESLKAISEQQNRNEVKAVQVRKGTIISKLVPCGKHCSGCPHGPYLYRVTRVNGKLVWEYLGKAEKSHADSAQEAEQERELLS